MDVLAMLTLLHIQSNIPEYIDLFIVEQGPSVTEGQNAPKTDVGTSLLNMVGNAIKQVQMSI